MGRDGVRAARDRSGMREDSGRCAAEEDGIIAAARERGSDGGEGETDQGRCCSSLGSRPTRVLIYAESEVESWGNDVHVTAAPACSGTCGVMGRKGRCGGGYARSCCAGAQR